MKIVMWKLVGGSRRFWIESDVSGDDNDVSDIKTNIKNHKILKENLQLSFKTI